VADGQATALGPAQRKVKRHPSHDERREDFATRSCHSHAARRITLQMGFPRGWEARCFWLSGRVQPAKSVPRFVDNAIASARSIPRWRCRQRVGILVPNGHELRDGFLEVLYAAEGTTADTHRRSFLTRPRWKKNDGATSANRSLSYSVRAYSTKIATSTWPWNMPRPMSRTF
jgi:hypothetical protein